MWQKYITNPEALESIFGSIPDLSNIELMEIILANGGNEMHLRFDVVPYPKQPPTKWIDFNTIQITLSVGSVKNLHIQNWHYPIQGLCTVSKNQNSQINFSFQSEGCALNFETEHLFIQKIGAYRDERRK